MRIGGHVRGFATIPGTPRRTSRTVGAAGPVRSGLTAGRPSASGRSRTSAAAAAASASVTTPITTNVPRQPTAPTRSASGVAAASAPTLPTVCVQPEIVANSFGRNQAVASASQAISKTEAPRPTRSRPANASENVGARPKSTAPSPIVPPPSAIVRRGPSVSARLPATSAITAKTYG
ncbi:MAG: hypothetical protein A2W08_12610 [Candidatus Rokubacteria bacterium RBG_16_73_20]|nr:MAG: hypothetical protein A2W08_12610 [Candidatus Rokubacteria bacterium RBG_16_73_20]